MAPCICNYKALDSTKLFAPYECQATSLPPSSSQRLPFCPHLPSSPSFSSVTLPSFSVALPSLCDCARRNCPAAPGPFSAGSGGQCCRHHTTGTITAAVPFRSAVMETAFGRLTSSQPPLRYMRARRCRTDCDSKKWTQDGTGKSGNLGIAIQLDSAGG